MRKSFIFLTVLALVLGMSVCAYAQEDKQEVISEDAYVEAVAETEVEEPAAEEPAIKESKEANVDEAEATEEPAIEEPVAEEPEVEVSEAEEAEVDETETTEAEETTADEDADEDEEETPNLTPAVRKVLQAAKKGKTVISVTVPEAYESMLLDALEAELPDDVEIVGFEVEDGTITGVILSFEEEAEADTTVDEMEDTAEDSELAEAQEVASDAEIAEEPETSEVKPVVAGHVPAETPVETSEDSERNSEVIADAKAEEKYLFSEE